MVVQMELKLHALCLFFSLRANCGSNGVDATRCLFPLQADSSSNGVDGMRRLLFSSEQTVVQTELRLWAVYFSSEPIAVEKQMTPCAVCLREGGRSADGWRGLLRVEQRPHALHSPPVTLESEAWQPAPAR